MRRTPLLLASAALLCACDDGPGSFLTADLEGTYIFRYEVADAADEVTCSVGGTIDLDRSESALSGTVDRVGGCMGPGDPPDLTGSVPIVDGRVSAADIWFETPSCRFEGTPEGAPSPSGASGSVTCGFSDSGFQGEWVLTLGVADIEITPGSITLATGSDLRLHRALYGPDGRRLPNRTVVWESSDPSIGSVDDLGRVEGLDLGSFVVRVTSVPVYPLEDPYSVEVPANVLVGLESVGAGGYHACGITSGAGGRAYCWGSNSHGQLGTGEEGDLAAVPRPVVGDLLFTSVSPGMSHTCGTTVSGDAYCWGSNVDGALGDGSGQSSNVPVLVAGGHTFETVVTGNSSSCGLTDSGEAYCWGADTDGQLGLGSIGGPPQPTPVAVVGGHLFTRLSMSTAPDGGGTHTCGISDAGAPYCWGHGAFGQLGNGGLEGSGTPEAVDTGWEFFEISAGWAHTCGVAAIDGMASEWWTPRSYCWGHAANGALGTGSTDPEVRTTPALVGTEYQFVQFTAGDHFTCAAEWWYGGEAYCWGRGDSHQLGNGTAADQMVPMPLEGSNWYSISAGLGFACGTALPEGGAGSWFGYCWGSNDHGQLGTGDFEPRGIPTLVVAQN